MSIQINGTDRINNNGKGIFAGVNLGSYTPNNRPSASTGDLIYNSTSKGLEVYNGSSWTQVGSAGPGTPYATGGCLLYTSPSPRDRTRSRMPSSA